jgi:hypothetical protein
MRRTSLIVIASCLLASFTAAQDSRPAGDGPKVTVPTFANATCPAMGKPAKPDLFVETDHGRVYICCKMCIKKVEADKEGMYKKAYPTAKPVGNKTCPSSGHELDKKAATVTIQGHEIGLCCNDCSKPLLENSQIWLAKLTNPKVNDVGNTTDPTNGKPVANNAFVLIGDDLVHLSSQDSVEAVKKDPKAALAKAKEGKSGEKKEAEKKGGPHDAGGCCSGKGSDDEGGSCCSGGSKAKAIAESRPSK